MNPPGRHCPECGEEFTDRCKLYRHTIDRHKPRYCWFCGHEEGRPSRLKRHVKRKHPTVDVENLPTPVYRSAEEPMMPVPEDTLIRVDAPEPYIPPGEQDAAVPCEYRPTRKRKDTSKSSSDESGEWDAMDEEFVLEEPPNEVPHTQSRTPSATVTCGESADHLSSVGQASSLQSTSTAKPVAIMEYRTRQSTPPESENREIVQAVRNLMRATGYGNVADSLPDGSSGDTAATIRAITRKVQGSVEGSGVSPVDRQTSELRETAKDDDLATQVPQPVGEILPQEPNIWGGGMADTEVTEGGEEDRQDSPMPALKSAVKENVAPPTSKQFEAVDNKGASATRKRGRTSRDNSATRKDSSKYARVVLTDIRNVVYGSQSPDTDTPHVVHGSRSAFADIRNVGYRSRSPSVHSLPLSGSLGVGKTSALSTTTKENVETGHNDTENSVPATDTASELPPPDKPRDDEKKPSTPGHRSAKRPATKKKSSSTSHPGSARKSGSVIKHAEKKKSSAASRPNSSGRALVVHAAVQTTPPRPVSSVSAQTVPLPHPRAVNRCTCACHCTCGACCPCECICLKPWRQWGDSRMMTWLQNLYHDLRLLDFLLGTWSCSTRV